MSQYTTQLETNVSSILVIVHHIREHTAAMALSLERLEEMAIEMRDAFKGGDKPKSKPDSDPYYGLD